MSFSGVDWVIDIGSGKQDIGKYIRANFSKVIAIDNDGAALVELIKRRYDLAKGNITPITLHTLKADINQPYKAIIPQIEKFGVSIGGADLVVCNLAIHYFIQDIDHIRNFAGLCNTMLKSGGSVSITCLFGSAVFKQLSEDKIKYGESWDRYQQDVLKYSIKRLFKDNTLTTVGQKIGVLLPFSAGGYYEEYLVNEETLISEFSKINFDLVVKDSFDIKFKGFEANDRTKYDKLIDIDFEFLKLFGEMVFKKK